MTYKERIHRLYLKAIAFFLGRIKKWHTPRVPLYNISYVKDFPDSPQDHLVYLLGKPGNEWCAGLSCPCGCGDFIELVLQGSSPSWTFSKGKDGRPDLSPSIFRSVGCFSHFFLHRGRIKWCK